MSDTVEVKYDPVSGEHYIEWDGFERLGWKEDDIINWEHNEDGSFTLTKQNNYQNDVEQFMAAADQYIGATPHLDDNNEAQAKLYIDLIDEEFRELCDGFLRRHIGDIADGGADLVWVVKGLFTTLGIDFDQVWEEIRASNMSKVVEGKVIRREDGKILKPDTYFKPDIQKVLKKQGM